MMTTWKILLRAWMLTSLIGMVTAAGSSVAQPYQPMLPDPVLEPWRWQVFLELEGFGLRCLAEAKDRAMWFGTNDGVRRYDGLHWTAYTPDDGLHGAPVDVLLGARDGTLYAGTQFGISQFTEGVWRRVFPSDGNVPWPVDALTEAEDGSIWAATAWGALHLSSEDTTLYLSEDMAVALRVVAPEVRYVIVPDQAVPARPWHAGLGLKVAQGAWFGLPRENGPVVIWALAPGGPARAAGLHMGDQIIAVDGQPAISRNRIKRYADVSVTLTVQRPGRPEPFEATLTRAPVEGAVRDFHVSDVHEAHDGSLWFALYEGEIVRYDPSPNAAAWRLYTASDGVELGWSPRITQTRDGAIWAVSGDGSAGVNRFDGTSWTNVRLSALGASDGNTSLLETRDGTLWVGGFALHALQDGAWTVYQHLEKAIPEHRTQLLEASDGTLWLIGMGQAAARLAYRSPRWTIYEGLNFQHETRDGTRWFVSSDGGVVRYADGTWTRYGGEDGLMETPVALIATREGALWAAGSHQGTAAIARFDGHAWLMQTHPDFSTSIYRNAVFQASDGALWLGAASNSPQSGVLRFHPSPPAGEPPWRHYAHPQAPPYVYGIGEMPDGVLWFGGHQLYRLDGATWVPMAYPDALSSFVTDIERAEHGGLWVGTRLHGVFHFDGEQWRQHDVRDGLADNQVEAVLPAPDGTVWVATPAGISRFDGERWTTVTLPTLLNADVARGGLWIAPDGALWVNTGPPGSDRWTTTRYVPDPTPPETALTVSLDRVSQPGNTILSWQGVDPWDDTPPEALHYAFRLNGGPWSAFSRATSQVFLSLPSGDHTFEVKARDQDFNEDPTPAVISFTVVPPVWKQAWFLALMLVVLGVVGLQARRIIVRGRRLGTSNAALHVAKERAESADRLKSTFLATMSHELRTPLNSIIGFTGIVLQGLPGPLNDEQKKQLGMVRGSARHLLDLINDILDISKIEAGEVEIVAKPFNMREAIDKVVRTVAPMTTEKGLVLVAELAPGVGRITSDRRRVEQVLLNLLNNAVKFTDEGEVRIECEISGDRLVTRLVDTGLGIRPEDMGALFEPFQQVDTGLARLREGTGLGLSICKRLVEMLGGEISVESEWGVGSVFAFTLPLGN